MQADYITLHHQQQDHRPNLKRFNSPQRVSSAQSAGQVLNRSDRVQSNKMSGRNNKINERTRSEDQDVTKHKKTKTKKSKGSRSHNTISSHHTASNNIIPLRVYNTNGEYFDTEMDSQTPLRVLQLAIEDYFKVKVSLQLLMHNRQQINPNYGLAANECKLLRGDPFVKLVFTIKRGPVLNLICHIHKYNNAYIPLACDEMSLIYELKGQLSDELNRLHANSNNNKKEKEKQNKGHKWSARRVRLFWRYNELNDRASIHSYGIPTNSVIEVQLKPSSHQTERSASSSSYMVEASQTIKPLTKRYKEPFAPQPLTYNMQDYMARQESERTMKTKGQNTKVQPSKKELITNNNNNNDEQGDNKYPIVINGRVIMPLHEDHLPNTPHHIFNVNNNMSNNKNGKILTQDEYYRQTFNYNTDSSSSASEDEWTFDQTAPIKTPVAPLFSQNEEKCEKRSEEPIMLVPPTNVPTTSIRPQQTSENLHSHNSNVINESNNTSASANMEMLNETIRSLQIELNALRAERQHLAHLGTTNQIYPYSSPPPPPQHSPSNHAHGATVPSKEHELFIKASERITQLERAVDHLHNYLQRAIHLIDM